MTKDMPSFQHYQQAFSAYIRDPANQPRPQDVPVERIAVYEEIVFNNLFEAVSACFPVAQKVMGEAGWLELVRSFLRDHSANSPIFRKIPEEFLSFLATQKNLASYIPNLCHYEWVELAVGSSEATVDRQSIDPTGDLLEYQPVFVPAMQLLNYDFTVHKISVRHKPKEKVNTQLLVYRNAEDEVKFIELNNVTYRLIELLQKRTTTGRQALTTIAEELAHPRPESVIQFGLEILEDLRRQGIILGVYYATAS
jgi:hypothetical protein